MPAHNMIHVSILNVKVGAPEFLNDVQRSGLHVVLTDIEREPLKYAEIVRVLERLKMSTMGVGWTYAGAVSAAWQGDVFRIG